ncbi:YtzC family protein [Peribacillus kribbensis]|uniref:YtzC family protein n=1 Tax=Peribacillus kribbensis TaxID=356658 RepID=UPI0003F66114|nr:YtzC family protein [Peribacillus kribbensis]
MATQESVEHFLRECEETLEAANEQFDDGNLQEHYNDDVYIHAQQRLETTLIELEKLKNSADSQQRYQLDRMRMRLQGIQNDMILLDH